MEPQPEDMDTVPYSMTPENRELLRLFKPVGNLLSKHTRECTLCDPQNAEKLVFVPGHTSYKSFRHHVAYNCKGANQELKYKYALQIIKLNMRGKYVVK